MQKQKMLFNRGLPKWPQMIVTGDSVSEEQALEIIRRTDTFFAYGWGGNDHQYSAWVKEVLGYPDVDGAPIDHFAETCRARENWLAKWGFIQTEYVCNEWIATCYAGGPHGWMHPDGSVGYAENIGKWPEVEEVYEDWTKIAEAFPFLNLEVTLMSGEQTEYHSRPVVSFLIRNGAVELVDPERYDIHRENGRERPRSCEVRLDFGYYSGERGLSPKQISQWAEDMKGKMNEPEKEDAE